MLPGNVCISTLWLAGAGGEGHGGQGEGKGHGGGGGGGDGVLGPVNETFDLSTISSSGDLNEKMVKGPVQPKSKEEITPFFHELSVCCRPV